MQTMPISSWSQRKLLEVGAAGVVASELETIQILPSALLGL
jgi:hypothetical protein